MNIWFADSGYYLALLNPSDEWHGRARELAGALRGRFVTTEWVLVEVANACSQVGNRTNAIRLIDVLRTKSNVTIIASDADLFEAGLVLYRERADKAWSLTDCISFLVMRDFAIRSAITADHHFEQAGFEALLR